MAPHGPRVGVPATRSLFVDPLSIAELVYEDFGYPKQMAPFIRYMPAGPSVVARTRSENESEMLEAWAGSSARKRRSFGAPCLAG